MAVGVSTSCFYPLQTEKSFLKLADMGIKCAEIFFNAPCETEWNFLNILKKIKDDYSIKVDTVHPYLSASETYFLFGNYPRRFNDILPQYERFFEVCSFLEAKYLVIHGCKEPFPISDDEYIERFAKLIEIGKKYNILPAQENVFRSKAQNKDFMLKLKNSLGADFRMVLDVKQAYRSRADVFDFVQLFANDIIRIHISDNDEAHDCLPPGEGSFDIDRLISEMKAVNYSGDYIIELYRHNFSCDEQILRAKKFLEGKINI